MNKLKLKGMIHNSQINLCYKLQIVYCILIGFFFFGQVYTSLAQTVIDIDIHDQKQIIDGFGAHQGNSEINQSWWQDLYYDDLRASVYRVDLTPRLISPYSDLNYYSPWFMGSGTNSVFNLEDSDNPDGPEGNRVRTYTSPEDYGRLFGGENAPIAVMGPDIDDNVAYFTYSANGAISAGIERKEALGDFKLIGSFWSPLPWVKVSSGNAYGQNWWPGPVMGTPWPFIWGGNFAGGRLDVSNEPRSIFDDSLLGGDGPTSSLTQFARSTAAYIRGYQNFHGIRFYAISLQNELNFEQFYNSATYPLASQYISALKAVRAEFDRYDDLKDIKIMGPEDLLGGDPYGMWQYGAGDNTIHKNLQYLQHITADPVAANAIDFFCIHGYDSDGISTSGATSTLWNWWVNGWQESPAAGLPSNVQGFSHYEKKSWMTETSGEQHEWLFPASGFPNQGGWSLALRIHQALTTGQQSAWIYWTFTESDDDGEVSRFALTNQASGNIAPKYVAAKHYFRYIRPGARRVSSISSGSDKVVASAYTHNSDGTLTVVALNTSSTTETITINVSDMPGENLMFEVYTSSNNNYWQSSTINFQNGSTSITLPGYSLMTLHGNDAISTAVKDPLSDTTVKKFEVFPNPHSVTATIYFELAQKAWVNLSICDVNGKLLRQLKDELMTAGNHEITLDSNVLAPGTYWCKLNAGASEKAKQMLLVK